MPVPGATKIELAKEMPPAMESRSAANGKSGDGLIRWRVTASRAKHSVSAKASRYFVNGAARRSRGEA